VLDRGLGTGKSHLLIALGTEEKASVAIASNESFSGWTKTFTDPSLCAAIVDRLTFGGTIIETGADSYRLAQRTKLVNA
jgi:DNA replication protein DnaC